MLIEKKGVLLQRDIERAEQKQMKKTLSTLLAMMPLMMAAQTFDFDMTKPQPIYDDNNSYGYDIIEVPDKKTPTGPFYFSVAVPDGNYRVTVKLGGKKNSDTTVRAEGRRLMMDHVTTKNAKDTQDVTFVVNKRSTLIEDGTARKTIWHGTKN